MDVKLFRKDIKLPEKSHLPDSGLDIFQPDDFDIDSLETKTLPLGLGISIPEGYAGMLVPRSSIAEKGLLIQTSIIDPDYSGEIHLIITNCSKERQHIHKGQRLCSLVVYNVLNPYINITDTLQSKIRKDKGLGSTGL